MSFSAPVKKDRRSKNLVSRLVPGDIALLDHEDIDRVTADMLVQCEVSYVINASQSISGKYPNVGPKVLLDKGLVIIDNVGEEIFDQVEDGDILVIEEGQIFK
ncbi:MAG: hypothetical protein Q4E22_05980, partial [Coriobacteriia bacterium]|nr:hypothetical protein [Coriobacteriia bacterium]